MEKNYTRKYTYKIERHCTESEQKTNDNNVVACNRALWNLNNLSLIHKWMNVFELKVINEKCHSIAVHIFFSSCSVCLPLSFVVLKFVQSAVLGLMAAKEDEGRKEREKKRVAKPKWQYCLCVVQFRRGTKCMATCRARSPIRSLSFVLLHDLTNKYCWRWVNYVCLWIACCTISTVLSINNRQISYFSCDQTVLCCLLILQSLHVVLESRECFLVCIWYCVCVRFFVCRWNIVSQTKEM